ncbi:MAG TPA: hypothetical protein VFW07_11635 [Parafilimonas sp.]|nr:hypothetical protein [Parafilimonas sp.]
MNKLFSHLVIICGIFFLFSCNKEFSVETGALTQAHGSLWDSTGNCLPETVHGTFYNGIVAGSDTAYVAVDVNVTQTGTYNITSDMQNGFQFFDSGFFSQTGINTIHLKPLGAAILPTPTTFTISFDSTVCSFTVNVQDSTGTGLGGDSTGGDPDSTFGSGDWQFSTDIGGSFQGTVVYVSSSPDTLFGSGGTLFAMSGFTASGDTAISIGILFPGNTIEPGTYHTAIVGSDTHSNAAFGFASITGGTIYDGSQDQGAPSDVAITVLSYDALTKTLTGTFSGPASNETTADVTDIIGILNGSFTATFP